jgi:hypothetical protein
MGATKSLNDYSVSESNYGFDFQSENGTSTIALLAGKQQIDEIGNMKINEEPEHEEHNSLCEISFDQEMDPITPKMQRLE